MLICQYSVYFLVHMSYTSARLTFIHQQYQICLNVLCIILYCTVLYNTPYCTTLLLHMHARYTELLDVYTLNLAQCT
jgi:hypothetical protein